MKKALLITLLISILNACNFPFLDEEDEKDTKIKILNYSNDTILCYRMYYSLNGYDTLLQVNHPFWDEEGVTSGYFILPDSLIIYDFNKENWQQAIFQDTEMYYFFDKEVYDKYTWEEIATGNMVLKRVDIYTWEELEDMNFEISYP
jgi:hypothetical protein